MDPTTHRWREITPSDYPWESGTLEFVRQALPDHEPYRAWSNFTLIPRDGGLNEVDLLVTSPKGVFHVEIKSRPGELTGDAGTRTWIDNGRAYTDDTPLILVDKKCERLKSLFEAQPAAKKADLSFIAQLLFCSDPRQVNDLPERLTSCLSLPDGRFSAPDSRPFAKINAVRNRTGASGTVQRQRAGSLHG